nr:T9SS type A sorting domain-containing protein [Bacteroidota bacterium]
MNDPERRGNIHHLSACVDNTGNTTTGYIFTGSCHNTSCPFSCANQFCSTIPVTRDRDLWIKRLDLNGNLVFEKKYDETDLASKGYIDLIGTANCSLAQSETNEQRGFEIYQSNLGSTQFVIVAGVDYNLAYGSGPCSNGIVNGQVWYLNTDVAVFRLDQSLNIINNSAKRLGFADGIEFDPSMAWDPTTQTAYVSATTAASPLVINTIIYKVGIPGGGNATNINYSKTYKGQGAVDCTFALRLTKDGGLIYCGNNELNNEDFFMVKIAPDCQVNQTYDFNTGLTIYNGTTVTWSTPKKIRGTIFIEDGAKLIINNGAEISFADTRQTCDYDFLSTNSFNYGNANQPTKIVVKPGGTLEIDGTGALKTTLKASTECNGTMWEGMEVWGDPGSLQTFGTLGSKQGYVSIKNGAIIQDMFKSITLDKCQYPTHTNWNALGGYPLNTGQFGGGVIKVTSATGAKFVNNRIAINWGRYPVTANAPMTNKSVINYATFESTAQLRDVNFISNTGQRLTQDAFVFLSGVNRIVFVSTKFKGLVTQPEDFMGNGIFTNSSSLNISWTNGSVFNFEHLTKGIYAGYGANSLYYVSASGNRFSNCKTGIETIGGSHYNFTNNYFALSNTTGLTRIGICTNGSKNFTISQNTFTGIGATFNNKYTYGILNESADINTSSVDHNTLTNLYRGEQTQKNCGNVNTGLSILCNSYAGMNNTAWAIAPQPPGTLTTQGVNCGPGPNFTQAGNVFSDPDCPGLGVPNSHINSTTVFTYYGTSNIINWRPTCVSAIVNNTDCFGNNNPNSCVIPPPCDPACAAALRLQLDTTSNGQQKELLRNRLVQYYLSIDSISNAINVMEADTTELGKKTLVPAYIGNQQYSTAQNMLNSISSTGIQNSNYKSFYQMLLTMLQNGLYYTQLSTPDVTALAAIANSGTSVAYNAQSILQTYFKYNYTRVIEDFGNGNGTRELETLSYNNNVMLTVFPNPTITSFTITYSGLDDGNNAFELYTMDGRKVKQIVLTDTQGQIIVDAQDLQNGIYTCILKCNGNSLGTTKIVIIK